MVTRADVVKMAIAAVVAAWPVAASADATVAYSNDFETDTSGFTAAGTLSDVTRASLPTDGGGLASPNQSMWLGKLGDGVGKSGSVDEIVDLALTDLEPGVAYFVSFDLLVGASWDGAAGCCGPDLWRVAADGRRMVDTMFSNGEAGVNVGAYSPQRYSDTNWTNPYGPDVPRFTGAEAFYSANQGGNYGGDYAIYFFGHGDGNPILEFVPRTSTATLEFARYGSTDSGDEYWALDNVVVETPEASSAALAAVAALAATRVARRRG